MDAAEKRRENFRKLCDRHGRNIVAQKLGYPDTNYVNQLYKNHVSFGRRTAAKIEAAFNLPHGWMDDRHEVSAHEADEHTARREELRRLLEQVPEENLDAAEKVILGLARPPAERNNKA